MDRGYRIVEEKITRKNHIIILVICALFSIFYYGLGFRINYQPDIYGRLDVPYNYYINLITSSDSRILTSILWCMLRWMPFSIYYYVALILSMGLMTIATWKWAIFLSSKISEKNSINNIHTIFTSLTSCITIANLFSSEYFLYTDLMVNSTLCIFLCVEASICFIKYIENKRNKFPWKAAIFLFFIPFFYEIYGALFIILTIPFILFISKSFSSFIKNQLLAGILYSAGMLAKTIYTMAIVHNDRATFDQKTLISAVEEYAPQGSSPQQFFLSRVTFGMWGYMILCLVISIVLIYIVIKSRQSFEIIKGLYIVIVASIVSFIPFITRLTDNYRPRIYYPIGSLFGVLIVYGILKGFIQIDKITIIGKICITSIVVMALIQWFSFLQMYTDAYITNYEDKYISQMIEQSIKRYEKENHQEIKYISFYDDAERTKYSIIGWCLTQRAYSSWGNLDALNFYMGEDYKTGETDMNIANYFIERNWNVFSEEQIIFKGNTAHICMY